MTDRKDGEATLPKWIDVPLGAVSVLAVIAAVLRVSGCAAVDREKLDATVLAFLLVPFVWALVRRAKKLSLSTSGFSFEALERTVVETKTQVEANAARLEETRSRVEQTAAAARDTRLAVAHGIGAAGKARPRKHTAARTRMEMRDQPSTEVVDNNNDPQKGRWGGQPERDGRRLSAHVEPVAGDAGWYRILLTVAPTQGAPPLRGVTRFHLHPTFTPVVVSVAPENGVARLERLAYGAFTVGAEIDDGATRLELDLADVPDAPAEFRAT